jgi:hypothetical protein
LRSAWVTAQSSRIASQRAISQISRSLVSMIRQVVLLTTRVDIPSFDVKAFSERKHLKQLSIWYRTRSDMQLIADAVLRSNTLQVIQCNADDELEEDP